MKFTCNVALNSIKAHNFLWVLDLTRFYFLILDRCLKCCSNSETAAGLVVQQLSPAGNCKWSWPMVCLMNFGLGLLG